jgi:hypothetical protein
MSGPSLPKLTSVTQFMLLLFNCNLFSISDLCHIIAVIHGTGVERSHAIFILICRKEPECVAGGRRG